MTLLTLFSKWGTINNEADNERRRELNVAALTHVQDLQFNDAGREIWYKYAKTEGEVDWDPLSDAQVQDWVGKVARIINDITPALNAMAEKMGEAIGVVEVYEEYQELKEKYC